MKTESQKQTNPVLDKELELKLNFIAGIALAYMIENLDSEHITPELAIMATCFDNDKPLNEAMNVDDEELPYKFFDYYMNIREALKTKGERNEH